MCEKAGEALRVQLDKRLRLESQGATMRTRRQGIILDMDSSESPVYGEQEGVACRTGILGVSATTTCSVSGCTCMLWQMEA